MMMTPDEPHTPIEQAANIGPVLAGELRQGGIETLEQLRHLGRANAWERLHAVAPGRDCGNALLALEGAIRGIRWMQLPAGERAAIVAEARLLRGGQD